MTYLLICQILFLLIYVLMNPFWMVYILGKILMVFIAKNDANKKQLRIILSSCLLMNSWVNSLLKMKINRNKVKKNRKSWVKIIKISGIILKLLRQNMSSSIKTNDIHITSLIFNHSHSRMNPIFDYFPKAFNSLSFSPVTNESSA